MEDVPSGRRRFRDGAVTVPQLLQRSTGTLRAAEFPLDPDDPLTDQPQPPGARPAHRARLAMGVVAVLFLVMASAAVSVITARATSTGAPTAAAGSAQVSGVDALRLDLMSQAHWPFHDTGDGIPARQSTSTNAGRAHSHDRDSANPAAGSPDSALELGRDFYRLLDTDPRKAAQLVAPELLGDRLDEVVRTWDSARSVRVVRIEVPSETTVRAEVHAVHADGSRTVLRHRLTVEEGAGPHIIGVDLLTARHSPA